MKSEKLLRALGDLPEDLVAEGNLRRRHPLLRLGAILLCVLLLLSALYPFFRDRIQGRGGKGLIGIRCTNKNGMVAGVVAISPGDEIMIITKDGIMIRTFIDDISSIGRATQGVKVMNLSENDQVQAVTKVVAKEEEE